MKKVRSQTAKICDGWTCTIISEGTSQWQLRVLFERIDTSFAAIPKSYSTRVISLWNVFVYPARIEFSPSFFFISGQKREVKEILFWSREKHLAESWWEGKRNRGGECKKTKACVRGDLSVVRFMDSSLSLFFWSLRITHSMLRGMIALLRQQSWISKWICTFHMAVT